MQFHGTTLVNCSSPLEVESSRGFRCLALLEIVHGVALDGRVGIPEEATAFGVRPWADVRFGPLMWVTADF